jgi:hypothetical protein
MDHPVLGMVFSIGFTALLNSSGVAMTVYISLCKQGLLTQSAGVLPCRVGYRVGCTTMPGGIPCRVRCRALLCLSNDAGDSVADAPQCWLCDQASSRAGTRGWAAAVADRSIAAGRESANGL